MTSNRAPKQWSLTITSFEAWRQNLQYILSLDANFAPFLADDASWQKKSQGPMRGFTDDGEDIPASRRRTAQQKCTHLDLMLGQIANYCPVISRNTIVKTSTSIQSIWQNIRMHFGFQLTGAHFIDFNNIKLEHNDRPEDLFRRLMSFVEDNLLIANSNITHHVRRSHQHRRGANTEPRRHDCLDMAETHPLRFTDLSKTKIRHRVAFQNSGFA